MRALPRFRLNRARRGLGLIEALISLAISAMLLVAIAAAFSGAASAIQTNDEFFRATQAGRVTLHHLLTHIRRGTVDAPSNTRTFRIITAGNDAGGGEEDRTYQFIPASKEIVLITNDDLIDQNYTLASNVADCTFTAEMGKDYNNTDCVARLMVSIVVTVGENTVRLSGSASPRKNLIY